MEGEAEEVEGVEMVGGVENDDADLNMVPKVSACYLYLLDIKK